MAGLDKSRSIAPGPVIVPVNATPMQRGPFSTYKQCPPDSPSQALHPLSAHISDVARLPVHAHLLGIFDGQPRPPPSSVLVHQERTTLVIRNNQGPDQKSDLPPWHPPVE